ncbi:MAG: EAL domain-containing protein [Gammaproteobacteria bacterium]|nr:EAL domain-containing protein [Gammaproteobacteria bacterium]MCP4088306.1 EAL domain-containing protein [Gammaproteobacteria bacterium]MCP4276383.1 EAL domain-containing protein [Gammaproteobacteria bacterium]MCP4831030.1 EAL domain-containing protein [Gammaproteobacteria bacterium]MCP4927449.1 EAL domain-containing protein [Gammaproteobacteria bacterium]
MKILFIEDNDADADFLRASLKSSCAEELDLTHVSTLKDGVIALSENDFDVLLLDVGLPDGEGMECIEVVQSVDPDMPIVVLSGHGDEDFAVSIINKGVQDYLVKQETKGRVILRAIRYAIERKRSERRLNYFAQYDGLTGIPNREFLTGYLDSAITRAEREKNKVALFYLDLDKFKTLNAQLGHEIGDVLLKEVAQRLYSHTRAGDLLCRAGGDEFAVVVEGLTQVAEIESIARKLINSLNDTFLINGREIVASASVGVTVYPDDSKDAQVLLKNADIAMYQAKEAGQNKFKYFTDNIHDEIVRKHKLEEDIQTALRLKQFALVYQSKVDIHTLQVKGMEALIRWNCPTRGLVRPADFIGAAEKSGYIVPLGYWIINDVCQTINNWKCKNIKLVPVSINVSALQFQQADFADRVGEILESHNIDPELIELEMTEGLLMADTDATQKCLTSLKAIGIKISVDDFGTGNSCLAYLQKFPIDILKIDKSFVDDVTLNADSDHICKAIISLAKSLGLEAVAEGVETKRQLEFLRENDCNIVQGYLFGRPVWGKEIANLFENVKHETVLVKSSQATNAQILNMDTEFLT